MIYICMYIYVYTNMFIYIKYIDVDVFILHKVP